MGTKVLIGNLPADTTEEEIAAVMTENGWPLVKVLGLQTDHPKHSGFLVEVDMPREEVNEIVRQRGEFYYKERKLRVYVPIMAT